MIRPPEGPKPTPTLDSLVMTIDYEEDRLTIHAPATVEVVQRSTTDIADGNTVIFQRRGRAYGLG
ncbi:hypothetical protein A5630_25345 [Mycolicibacterium mucogenicum]|uniref:Uncharacterized protein n=1 Tax=Mycolicibacterium mucogenicum TaxID=56689 RepID=A0A1A3GY59_MYCMU|nr:hypothetical protein [Mycolicibacterium mucogenicum]OBJ40279.1 hypothetical protein A5630_25345 [Mycolicibacterium mucogenicum]